MTPDLVIFQWWHPYFAPCYFFVCKFLKKTKILFICHNVLPHERFWMDQFFVKMVLKQGDYYIVQSKADEIDLNRIIQYPSYKRTVHPSYNAFKIQNMSMETARLKLKIPKEKKVILFFGFIREYKGLKYLVQAMPAIVSRLRDVELLIVGDFKIFRIKKVILN